MAGCGQPKAPAGAAPSAEDQIPHPTPPFQLWQPREHPSAGGGEGSGHDRTVTPLRHSREPKGPAQMLSCPGESLDHRLQPAELLSHPHLSPVLRVGTLQWVSRVCLCRHLLPALSNKGAALAAVFPMNSRIQHANGPPPTGSGRGHPPRQVEMTDLPSGKGAAASNPKVCRQPDWVQVPRKKVPRETRATVLPRHPCVPHVTGS